MSRMICPERGNNPQIPGMPTTDEWRSMPDGTRTCSYCGSLHPDDFVDILYGYLGDDSFKFEPTSKGYKVYANRPGTRNASEGGIKFYTWHDACGEKNDRTAVAAAYDLAIPIYRSRYRKRFPT